MADYDVGDQVRCSTGDDGFTNSSGSAYDPSTVKFHFTDPSGNTTTYTYNTDDELVKDSTGKYHVDVAVDQEGEWKWRWEGISSGDVGEAADEGTFKVATSSF